MEQGLERGEHPFLPHRRHIIDEKFWKILPVLDERPVDDVAVIVDDELVLEYIRVGRGREDVDQGETSGGMLGQIKEYIGDALKHA